ncbi:MAG: hypothetical protein AAFP90_17145, partial [Planctomycetota bacterium]
LICPPTYRCELEIEQGTLTVIGPARLTIASDRTLRLTEGRFLLSAELPIEDGAEPENGDAATATAANRTLQMVIGGSAPAANDGRLVQFDLADPPSTVAILARRFRRPGDDPTIASSSVSVGSIISLAGDLAITTEDGDASVPAMQQWTFVGNENAAVVPVASAPEWIRGKDVGNDMMAKYAAPGLLKRYAENSEKPFDLLLRETVNYRRSEVAALAAQTLLLLGRPNAFFGSDGVFYDIKQKPFWPLHAEALRDALARGPVSTQQVVDAVSRMEATESAVLLRQLQGYDQSQIDSVGTKAFVDGINSNSMTTRVLTTEALRQITGNTLNLKPEIESNRKRADDRKKLSVALKTGKVKWTSVPKAQDLLPPSTADDSPAPAP